MRAQPNTFHWRSPTRRPFTVLGLGRSGIAAANALAGVGASVRAHDESDRPEVHDRVGRELLPSIEVALGEFPPPREGEVYVVSPGYVADSPRYLELATSGYPVVDETEIFYHLMRDRFPERPCRIVGITGTNGKTTTTSLISHLLRSAGTDVVTGGNIGVPLCSQLDRLTPDTVVVVELSEIHLLGGVDFHCDVAVITNVDYDHVIGLPIFGGVAAAYHECKWTITDNLTPADTLVYSEDCPITARMVASRPLPCRSEPTSVHGRGRTGWYLDGHGYRRTGDVANRYVARRSDVSALAVGEETVLLGEHNHSNVLLALAAVTALGTPAAGLPEGLRSFRSPAHRINLMTGTPHGMVVIDDSKATNPHSVLAALRVVRDAYPSDRIVWVGGGQRDQAPKDELAQALPGLAAVAVLVGESADEFDALLRDRMPTVVTDSMRQAARSCLDELRDEPGVVLFSPAAKSFDMFTDYAHRAAEFRAAVGQALAERQASAPGPADG
ncbi:UDP-N-acetylmuramoyl-L-alanine--D-glutamate ligase [Catellatospora chokoriensis]|uniref:UDP-N-acetylmuramoylalanine--D-glutamate ligase n=1 Tax=Catellatospora chokoriensis TaxID=310353 RepID=A0A8J3JV68_9ACTN|nr:UDP-N-acetylmuramoyl-L-alanine--D-glutamate ligase [Catellatospora chokoriensis]GIF87661.1 UDP-N-acetylmuramoylalanine--D-glutamate ligase [Catellatospora chokoriensis]